MNCSMITRALATYTSKSEDREGETVNIRIRAPIVKAKVRGG